MPNISPESSSRRLIGVAISANTLTVPGVGVWPLAPRQPGYDQWEALHEAFVALATQMRATTHAERGGRLAVALLPPLTAIRSITLPKLRDAELQAVLTRNVAKYFPSIREPHTVAAITLGVAPAGTPGGDVVYTIAVAPSSLLAAIEHAAAQSGWSVDRFLPAYSAWATIGAARASTRHGTRGTATIIIPREDGVIDVLSVVRSLPYEVRKRRANAPAQEQKQEHGDAGAVTIDRPADVAARQVTSTRTLELVTGAIRDRRRAGTRSIRTLVALAAGMLLVAALGGQWWRIRHQLQQVAADRAALAPTVATARRAQATLLTLMTPAQTLTRIEERGVRWSAALTELTDHLPPDAYVSGLRATSDSLSVEAVAENGARVFQTVVASPMLTTATPVGPIRRDLRTEQQEVTEPMERFTLLARLPNAVPVVPLPPRGHHP